jgi:hypothetical protein
LIDRLKYQTNIQKQYYFDLLQQMNKVQKLYCKTLLKPLTYLH